ncbi:protein TIFY 5A-like [Cynara cardunculus var. scolymus]|uniref:Protein TIFY n=1 Tax=Cynara cardunculus var. scolymus TaxID=59895 RepID=A0A118JSL2_CYNCS|nr:protein TIFY 5A-like [Cynara cardunculus var. scolymus]KVH89392.1 CO/COL/TOC1, conserved site-containing protein [Cynara cardunculus var. scolymus]
MRRNCNLTLRLVPPSPHSDHRQQHPPIDGVDLSSKDRNQNQNQNQNQQLTIFYGGRVSVCDVTDTQARAIIKVASEEIEEKWRSRTPGSPLLPSPSGLSMKMSLQSFLQKRKHRIQATSPYHH